MSMESKPTREKNNSSLDALRGKMLKALAVGSFALFLQACELTRAEIDAMPTTSVEEINKSGRSLTEQLVIKTEGFVEDLGKKGETQHTPFFSKWTTLTHRYILRSSLDPKSSSVGMIATYSGKGDSLNRLMGIGMFDNVEFPSFNPKHKIEIMGAVVTVEEGKEIKYVLKISRDGGTFDLTAATPEKKD